MNVDCEAMKAEGGAKGRGVLVKGILTCRVADAEAVTWLEMAESEPSASPNLTVGHKAIQVLAVALKVKLRAGRVERAGGVGFLCSGEFKENGIRGEILRAFFGGQEESGDRIWWNEPGIRNVPNAKTDEAGWADTSGFDNAGNGTLFQVECFCDHSADPPKSDHRPSSLR